MGSEVIAYAIPFFFGLIALEIFWIKFVRKEALSRFYQFSDSITNLNCGILDQVFGLIFIPLFGIPYAWIYKNWAWVDYSKGGVYGSLLLWTLAFVGVDFLYYWWHRLSHEINFLWAAHIVHHQSEYYNLSVALRQAMFVPLFAWVFYLPLAFLGVPIEAFALSKVVSLLYQFWIHTETIGKLGILESVLNTPSHHRVHHATNIEYLDKNHGAILIIWDRLFGTFALETERPKYGITTPLQSYNPIWANLHYWRDGWRVFVFQSHGLIERLKVWFSSPAWLGQKLKPLNISVPLEFVRPTPLQSYYVGIQFLIISVMTFFVLLSPGPKLELDIVMISCGALFLGGILQSSKWALRLEPLRLLVLVMYCFK